MMRPSAFGVCFVLWLIVYAASKIAIAFALTRPFFLRYIPDAKRRANLKLYAPAYAVSTIHAIYITARGLRHLSVLVYAPRVIKLRLPAATLADALPHQSGPFLNAARALTDADTPFIQEVEALLWTNLILAAYLGSDLVHVLGHYPHLGSWDTVAHHVAFMCCAAVAGWYKLYPFMFCWLSIGEFSTPFLNARWFFIKAGHGDTSLFKNVQLMFGIAFILTRFFVYGTGLFHQLYIVSTFPVLVPRWVSVFLMGLVIIGFGLNLTWLRKITRLALRSREKRSAPPSRVAASTASEMPPESVRVKSE